MHRPRKQWSRPRKKEWCLFCILLIVNRHKVVDIGKTRAKVSDEGPRVGYSCPNNHGTGFVVCFVFLLFEMTLVTSRADTRKGIRPWTSSAAEAFIPREPLSYKEYSHERRQVPLWSIDGRALGKNPLMTCCAGPC